MSDERDYGSNGNAGYVPGTEVPNGYGYHDPSASSTNSAWQGSPSAAYSGASVTPSSPSSAMDFAGTGNSANPANPANPQSSYTGVSVPFNADAIFNANAGTPTKAPRGMDFESIMDSLPSSADSYTTDGDNAVDVKRRSLLNEKLTNGRRVELIVSLVASIAMIFVHNAMRTGAAGVITATIMNAAFVVLLFSLVRTCFKYDLAFVTGLRRAVIIILTLLGVASAAGLVYYALDVPGVFNPTNVQLSALQVQGNSTGNGPYTLTGKAPSGNTMTFSLTQDEYYACNTGLSGVDTKYRSATISYLPHTKTLTSLTCGSSK